MPERYSRVLNFPYISLHFFPRTIFSSSSRLVRYTELRQIGPKNGLKSLQTFSYVFIHRKAAEIEGAFSSTAFFEMMFAPLFFL